MDQNRDELMAELAKLQAENTELKAHQPKAPGITIKLGEKKNVCIYGLGRFPISLYKSQADRLFSDEIVAKVRAFVVENEGKLAVKSEK